MSDPKRTRIGTITLNVSETFKTMEQTACNYRLIEVASRTTAVLYLDTRNDLSWTFEGTCKQSYFVNRLGASSSVCEDRESGKPMDWHGRSYGYDLLRLMYDARYKIVLDEGCEVSVDVVTRPNDTYPHTSVLARITPPSCIYSEVA